MSAKRRAVSIGILALLCACAGSKIFTRESVIAPIDETQSLENLSLAVIALDTLTISYNQNRHFPAKKYRYYIKHKLPNIIKAKTRFTKSEFQFVVTNMNDVVWEKTVLSINNTKINRPVDQSVLHFPNNSFDFVLILNQIDVFARKKRVLDSISDIVTEHAAPEVVHCIRYVLWDNRNKNALAYGMTEIPSVALEYYFGTQRWNDLMSDIAEQVFENTPFQIDQK